MEYRDTHTCLFNCTTLSLDGLSTCWILQFGLVISVPEVNLLDFTGRFYHWVCIPWKNLISQLPLLIEEKSRIENTTNLLSENMTEMSFYQLTKVSQPASILRLDLTSDCCSSSFASACCSVACCRAA